MKMEVLHQKQGILSPSTGIKIANLTMVLQTTLELLRAFQMGLFTPLKETQMIRFVEKPTESVMAISEDLLAHVINNKEETFASFQIEEKVHFGQFSSIFFFYSRK